MLPDLSQPVAFDADYVSSATDGSYYWLGYAADGGVFDLSKLPNGNYFGGISITGSGARYQILSLSTSKCLLVKYSPQITGNDCGAVIDPNPGTDDDEGEIVVDRTGCEVNLIRVLFLFTPTAAATGLNPTDVALTSISEMNAAAAASGIYAGTVTYYTAAVLPLAFTESPSGNIVSDHTSLINN